ncbi:MAG TPA: NAD-dependent epimerase/dehydratase family protein [Blastocatellia bacterium]|nr:NAD-dependent epimerase/dehydratase family protein [Blastocatellia bacterium]
MILVTGGAGFIGSHLVDGLLKRGHRVRVLDSFVEQVHGSSPFELPSDVEVITGDVRDRSLLEAALDGVEVVFHEAAEVGVGQSMYEIEKYVGANTFGTAAFLEALIARRGQVKKLIVASSMSIYGEGAYECRLCGRVSPSLRPLAQLESGSWEMLCPNCNETLEPVATSEAKPLDPASVYAVTKQDQEQLCIIVGRAYGIPTVALRYFNVYGPRQALSNPYTGVAAIFSSRLLNGQPPLVFEDGLQSRDFTHVDDIVQANLRAMESEAANFQVINVGTGVATSVKRIAELLATGLGVSSIEPRIVKRFREGDIRHCFADISRARALLGYEPTISLEDGIPQLLEWAREQKAVDGVEKATEELSAFGLVR